MNLQLVSPYRKCPYGCPFCVAGTTNEFPFRDTLWLMNEIEYFQRLEYIIQHGDYERVVITGSTEPTLFPEWLDALEKFFGGKGIAAQYYLIMEMQTRNYHYVPNSSSMIDIIAYSRTEIPCLGRTPEIGPIVRDVFILQKSLPIADIVQYHKGKLQLDPWTQTTVKVLADNSYGTEEINAYVRKNRYVPTNEEIAWLKEENIWYDANCNEGEGRYHIYRPDGNLYGEWGSMEPLEI